MKKPEIIGLIATISVTTLALGIYGYYLNDHSTKSSSEFTINPNLMGLRGHNVYFTNEKNGIYFRADFGLENFTHLQNMTMTNQFQYFPNNNTMIILNPNMHVIKIHSQTEVSQ